jgi:hypothetical protein
MTCWGFKAKGGFWHFTKNKPYNGEPYYTFRFQWGVMHENPKIGEIGTSSVDKIHRSFRQMSLMAIIK